MSVRLGAGSRHSLERPVSSGAIPAATFAVMPVRGAVTIATAEWRARQPCRTRVRDEADYLGFGVGNNSTGGCVTAGPERSAGSAGTAVLLGAAPPAESTLRVPSGASSAAAGETP